MKVVFTLNPFQDTGGGSYSFARVLADTLQELGVQVGFNCREPADVVLVFAHFGTVRLLRRQRKRGARIIHRLDERIDLHEARGRKRKHQHISCLNAHADLTIFQSEFVSKNMGPICSAPLERVIHNGIDPQVFCPEGPKVALEGNPRILHVSWSVGETKRLDRMSELLDTGSSQLRLYCVGRHQETTFPWLNDPRVRLLGTKTRWEVATLMRSADFLFFPSELEPCPNTIIEAMATGLPCLYHPSGGTPELIGDVGVPITHSLRENVEAIMNQRNKLSQKSLCRVQRFLAKPVVEKYVAVMSELIRTSVKPPVSRWRKVWDSWGF